MADEPGNLHVVMLPWLAMGHLLPFFQLSKHLAAKGIRISFFSTPSNIHRLPSIPQTLTPLLSFIPCSPSPSPSTIDNTIDLLSEAARPLLRKAYAGFEHHLTSFLSDPSRPKADWIIYDFEALNWAPALASQFNISSAYFCLINAAAVTFFVRANDYSSPENLTKVPASIPFPTTVAFRPFEARQICSVLPKKTDRIESESESKPWSSQLTLIRTCKELENKWVDLLGDVYLPVGFLPPSFDEKEESEPWMRICEWLDEQKEQHSVIYAAFGSEVILTPEQIDQIALGLEKSGLPFVWVLRMGSPPQGFEERIAGRGLVWRGWVPQARLLAHRAVGGFLTHGGWNSVVEGMVVGAAMAVLPMQFEQGLTARHLAESGYAVEVVRNDEDGSFSGEEIARKVRMVMVEEEGEGLRKKARKGKEIFGSEKLQEEYITELVKNLWQKRTESV